MIRVADFYIKGTMVLPDDVDGLVYHENETWEFEKSGFSFKLTPSIEVEDKDGNIIFLNTERAMKQFGFEIGQLNDASWVEE